MQKGINEITTKTRFKICREVIMEKFKMLAYQGFAFYLRTVTTYAYVIKQQLLSSLFNTSWR